MPTEKDFFTRCFVVGLCGLIAELLIQYTLSHTFAPMCDGNYKYLLALNIGSDATVFRTIYCESDDKAIERAESIVNFHVGAYLETEFAK